MNIFTKKIRLAKEKSIDELIRNHPICSSINNLEPNENGDYWLNPSDQKSFRFGRFTKQDFIDWMNGKGAIIKGESDNEKQKFWDHAVFLKNYEWGWKIGYYYKHFNLLGDEKYIIPPSSLGMYGNKSVVIDKNQDEKEVISKIISPLVSGIQRDFQYRKLVDIRREFDSEWYGTSRTLALLGFGYFGASNTPEKITNLSWCKDLVLAKSYYNYLLEEKVEIPDFEFIDKNRFS